MVATIVSGSFKLILWGLAAAGFVTLVLAALVATPVRRPPELISVSNTAGAVDRSDMPGIERFHGRDGTELAYRHHPARPPAAPAQKNPVSRSEIPTARPTPQYVTHRPTVRIPG